MISALIMFVMFMSPASTTVPPPPTSTTVPPPPASTTVPPPPASTTVPPPPTPVTNIENSKGDTVGPFGTLNVGDPFDDGLFEGVRTVTMFIDDQGITGMSIQYVANQVFHLLSHGISTDSKFVFEVAFPEEFITSITGSQTYHAELNTSFLSSLSFTTSHGQTKDFGSYQWTSTSFTLEPRGGKGEKLLGFLGNSGRRISALGAHFGLPPSHPKKGVPKLVTVSPGNGVGVIGDFTFDDGVFDGLKMVTFRVTNTCITYMNIEYVRGDAFQSRDHGSYTNEEQEIKFELAYPEEYIKAIAVSWTVVAMETQVLGIKILTSYSSRLPALIGMWDANSYYILKPKSGLGPRLVGLLGRSGASINAIGARFDESSDCKASESFFLAVIVVLMGLCV